MTVAVTVTTGLLAGLETWRNALAKHGQDLPGILSQFPDVPWWAYVIGVLSLAVVVLFETSYRLYRSTLFGKNKRSVLVNLWNDGSELMELCIRRSLPDPENALSEWNKTILEEVAKVDPSYVIEFSNQPHIGIDKRLMPAAFDNYPENDVYVQCYMWITWRMEKLKELTSELRKTHVTTM